MPDWKGFVVNDDPEDPRVADVVNNLCDSRLTLFQPIAKRGAVESFNLAFRASDCEFSSLLEDDNWWEPNFLKRMLAALNSNPNVDIAVANERVWRESLSGQWINTNRTIWPDGPDQLFSTSVDFACGSSKLCNSSMLVRRLNRAPFLTPKDIPVDVTEHFRERCVNQPILLVREPLVNFAETLHTSRQKDGILWGAYQALLIASCFHSLVPLSRVRLAQRLVSAEAGRPSPRITSLATTALFFPEVRAVWLCLNWRQLARTFMSWTWRFQSLLLLGKFIRSTTGIRHFDFLINSPFNVSLHEYSDELVDLR